MKCASCGMQTHSKFCSNCGAAVLQQTACVVCGGVHTGKFCPECGQVASIVPPADSPRSAFVERQQISTDEVTIVQAGEVMRQEETVYTQLFDAPVPRAPKAPSIPTIVINNVNTTTSATVSSNAVSAAGAPANSGGNEPMVAAYDQSMQAGHYVSYKSRLLALGLCAVLGVIGVHRFYVGKIGTGLLYLFTGGFFGIGWVVDMILIAAGGFRDSHGFKLENWG